MESRAIFNTFIPCQQSSDCGDSPDLRVGVCNATTGTCQCILTDCYDYNNQTNHCDLKACHAVEGFNDDGQIICISRGGKSKRKALFLNMISFTGATNFYLGNYIQASFQSLLFILMLIFCGFRVASCCYVCVNACCNKKKKKSTRRENFGQLYEDKADDKKQIINNQENDSEKIKNILYWIAVAQCSFSCFDCLSTVISAIELGWMIFDFIMIGINGKLDGNGCLLDDDTVSLIQDIVLQTGTLGK